MRGCQGVHGCGGHAWLLGGNVWLWGACVVAGGMHGCGGHAWLQGGMYGCEEVMCGCWGECMVVGGHAWLWGACMVAGGCAWLWGACVVAGGCIGYDEIRSMSGRYASYWNAFLLKLVLNESNGYVVSNVSPCEQRLNGTPHWAKVNTLKILRSVKCSSKNQGNFVFHLSSCLVWSMDSDSQGIPFPGLWYPSGRKNGSR